MSRELDRLYLEARASVDALRIEFQQLEPGIRKSTQKLPETPVVQPQEFKPVLQQTPPPVAFGLPPPSSVVLAAGSPAAPTPSASARIVIVTNNDAAQTQMRGWLASFSKAYTAAFSFLANATWFNIDDLKSGQLSGTRAIYAFFRVDERSPGTHAVRESVEKLMRATPTHVLLLYVQNGSSDFGNGNAQRGASYHYNSLDNDVRVVTAFVGLDLEKHSRNAPETPTTINEQGILTLKRWIASPSPPAKPIAPSAHPVTVASPPGVVQQLPSTVVSPEAQLLPAVPPQVLPSGLTTWVTPPVPVSAASAPFVVVTRAVDQEYMKSMLQTWLKYDPVSFAPLRNVQWVTLDKVNDDAVKLRNTIFAFHVGDISKLEVGPVIRDAQSVWVHQPAKKLLMLYVIEANDIATVPQVQAEKHWTQLGPTTQSKTAVVGIEVNRTKQDRNKNGLDMLQKWIREAMREPVRYVYNPVVVYIPTRTSSKEFESEVFSDSSLTHLHALKDAPSTNRIEENQIAVILVDMPTRNEQKFYDDLIDWEQTSILVHKPRAVLLLLLFQTEESKNRVVMPSTPQKTLVFVFVRGDSIHNMERRRRVESDLNALEGEKWQEEF